MNIIFCGGGTAGHITPAIAVAKELRRRNKDSKILFIGRHGGNENDLITKAGFPLTTLKIKGLKRKLTLQNLVTIKKALYAKKEAKQIIKAFTPDAILGTGGYVCWPVIKAGYEIKVPTFIHESNIFPGLTTRLLANKCRKLLLYSEETKQYLSKKAESVVVGNPIERDFFTTSRSYARTKLSLSKDDLFILSYGGSLGAEKINKTIITLMKNFSSKESHISHLHATGKLNFKNEYKTMFCENTSCKIVPFIDNMALYLNAADIVISRSGAMTIAELSAAKAPSILIPSPNVADNHQFKNASILQAKNAAVIITEDELNEETLAKKIKDLANNKEERRRMSNCIELFAKRDVECRIIEEISSALE